MMRKDNSDIKTGFLSEAGSFLKNGDYFAFVELEDCACYCIADGIDNDPEKESARLAVTAAIASFHEKPKFSKGCAKRCILAAHNELKQETDEIRLEASITILLTNYQKYMWIQAGNTRFLQFRNTKPIKQSVDQSLSQSLAEQGRLPKDRVEEHEERHNLYTYLGQPEAFKPCLSKKIKMQDGDILLMCTRGIWQNTSNAEYLDAMEEAKTPGEVVGAIEEFLLSRRMKHLDNYTAVCLFIDKIYNIPSKKKKIIKRVLIACIPFVIIAMVLTVILVVKHNNNEKKIESMLTYKEKGERFFREESYERAMKEFDAGLQAVKNASFKDKKAAAEERQEIESYDMLIQTLLDAKERADSGKMAEAVKKYSQAIKISREILSLEQETKDTLYQYLELAQKHFAILEAITSGDLYYSIEVYDKAVSAYSEAEKMASEIYDAASKKEAAEKLAKVKQDITYQEQEKMAEKAKEQEDIAKEKADQGDISGALEAYQKAEELYIQAERKDKAEAASTAASELKSEDSKEQDEKQKEQKLLEAVRLEQSGDAKMEAGSYQKAYDAYMQAVICYQAADAADKIPPVEAKIVLADNKNTVIEQQKEQAKQYLDKAKAYEQMGENDYAFMLYDLAKEIYHNFSLTAEEAEVKKSVKELKEKLAEEQRKKEEEEAQKKSEEEAQKKSEEEET